MCEAVLQPRWDDVYFCRFELAYGRQQYLDIALTVSLSGFSDLTGIRSGFRSPESRPEISPGTSM